jgi:hypothetical protein
MKQLIILIFLFYFTPLFSQVFFVNAAATGANTGSDWSNAYTDLQTALIAAQNGDSIWVAAGDYYPTPTGDRTIYFQLKNGVKIIGGFAGTEQFIHERNWQTHPTILSGDLGVIEDSTDNSYTIMYMTSVDTSTLVDGFVFRDGNANLGTGGFQSVTACGGAMYIEGRNSFAYPRIWNCRFEHNTAIIYGGAVYVNGNEDGSVAPQFYNCVFENNHAYLDGGGVRKDGGSWVEIKNDFQNCVFSKNVAGRDGGGTLFYRDRAFRYI